MKLIPPPWCSSGVSFPERFSPSFPVERHQPVLWYYYLNVYSLPFSAHQVPGSVESDRRTQVASAPSAPCLAAGRPLYGVAADGPSGLRCSPRYSRLQPASLRARRRECCQEAHVGVRWPPLCQNPRAEGVLGLRQGLAFQDWLGTKKPY